MVIFFVSVIIVFLIAEYLYRRGLSNELSRKTVHVSVCSMIAVYPQFNIHEDAIVPLGIGAFVAVLLLRSTRLMRSVMSVDRRSFGDLLIPLAPVCVMAIPVGYPSFAVAFLVLGLSDSLASIVGQRYGRRRYRLIGRSKSVEGSLAFFVSCSAIIVAATIYLQQAAWDRVAGAVAVAFILTGVEAALEMGFDNLALPLSTAMLFHLLSTAS